MAEVSLMIGGRAHRIACADGQEAQLERLGAMVAERWDTAQRAAGGAGAERTMLLIALMLADALSDARRDSGPQGAANGLDVLATRLEAVATALEQNGKSA
ncbi:MAG: cell division protein ZapA [Sphingomonas sp.]|uniref:cell division protein ZapA n=1 Tax=Sphingomonas sp. TaxID=28214 RepID=UPI00179E71EE|nr:cell division protein ZapA [Zymomonas sp.]MBA4772208.1 cell division protein ZapA [Sphingomonas sp.]